MRSVAPEDTLKLRWGVAPIDLHLPRHFFVVHASGK
jgi:hypothetical protein